LKKYQKFLMLSAVILSSTQGVVVGASEILDNNNTSGSSEVVSGSSTEGEIEGSTTPSTDTSIGEDVDNGENSWSSVPEQTDSGESTDILGTEEEVVNKDTSKEADSTTTTELKPSIEYKTSRVNKKNLPKVSVKMKVLPVKHPGNSPYRDVSGSIYKNYINWIYSRGITTGYTPTTYKPDYLVTRGEMAVFLHRLAGSPGYKPPFNVYTDVSQYKNQILWLTATNVSNGTIPHYNPNGTVTRGQMAAFLHRMAKESGYAPKNGKYNTKFWDTKNHMFKNDIGWLSSQGITTGYTATYFKPDVPVTRGQMAAFINRFYNVTVGGKHLNPAPQPHASEPVYYSQLDGRWANVPLNASTVGPWGCVPTSIAMVLRGSYGQNVDPGVVARKADGISHEAYGISGRDTINTIKAYGRGVEQISSQKRAEDLLRAGYPLIFFINIGVGHSVVAYGYDDGKVNVNDPASRRYYPSGKTTLSELWGRPSPDAMDWNAGRPVFAIK